MMKTSGIAAREAVEGLGPRRKTTRIPDEVRLIATEYTREARSTGKSWNAIAETVGLSASLLQRWAGAGRGKPTRNRAKLKPVVVTQAPSVTHNPPQSSRFSGDSCTGLVLVMPHGERLEGLEVESVIRILGALR